MTKGIRKAACVLLLEAMVLLSAGTQWAGAWTQRMYGTGSADVWEVGAAHTRVSELAWKQGWRVCEPLVTADFNTTLYQETISDTLQERSPRLVVVEAPPKIWANASVVNREPSNAKNQKLKSLRKVINPFFDTACSIANHQLQDSHDFIIEFPLALSSHKHEDLQELLTHNQTHSRATRTKLLSTSKDKASRATWWVASSEQLSSNASDTSDKPVVAKQILSGFRTLLLDKDPDRMHRLARSLDTRIRAAGVFADENLVSLRAELGARA